MTRLRVAEQLEKTHAMLGSMPRSRALGFVPNELELFAFERYGLSSEARDTAVIAARDNPVYAMRCYMAIFYSVGA